MKVKKDGQSKKWRRALVGLFAAILLALVLLLPTKYVIEGAWGMPCRRQLFKDDRG